MSEIAEAEANIRQLYAHYADAVWRRDPVAFAECFTADAEWRISGMVLRGSDEIAANFQQISRNATRLLMAFDTPILNWKDGQATGRVRVTERCAWSDRPSHFNIGTYYDRYTVQGGRWRFSWRLFHLFYKGPPDLTGAYYDNPDYGPPPNMPPLDAIPDSHRA